MTLPVVFPDAVDLAISYLTPALAAQGNGAVAVAQVPDPRPDTFVRVIRTGGLPDTPVTDAAQLTVDCWAQLPEDAQDLAQLCRALLHAIKYSTRAINGVAVAGVIDVGGPVDLPDPDSKQARYTFTVTMSVRGAPLAT